MTWQNTSTELIEIRLFRGQEAPRAWLEQGVDEFDISDRMSL